MFGRSIEKHVLRYTQFYGDGSSKSFDKVKNMYDGVVVEKQECVGHIQKKVGNRLRKLIREVKGLGGTNRLTGEMIDKLQNYFGIAIRSNVGNLEGMMSAVAATLFHVASNEKKPWHVHCPVGKKSWCGFQRDIASETSTYKDGAGLPMDVIKQVKPIFEDLSNETLLKSVYMGRLKTRMSRIMV